MTVVSVILFALWQGLLPIVVGSMFRKVHKGIIFYWISGQMLLWAGFQLLAVQGILSGDNFRPVVWRTLLYAAVLLVCSSILYFRNGRGSRRQITVVKEEACTRIRLLYLLAIALLLFQLIMTVCYAYEEGDDAFYLAITTTTVNSDTMYLKHPYNGFTTGLDGRHGLAPFPIWVALLCQVTGIVPITMSHIMLPLALIVMAYGIHYVMGGLLFKQQREQQLLYLVFVEALTLFGGYSLYSSENFLLVRTSQGKAVLCNLILPFMVFLYLRLLEYWKKEKKAGASYWVLLFCTTLSGCLCSTQGGLIVCMSLGLFGLVTAFVYRRLRQLPALAACCVLPIVFLIMYVFMA